MCGRNLTIPAGSCDQSAKVESRKDVRVFSTPKLSKAVEVTGRVRAHLWVSIDQVDADLMVRLTDVYPSGKSMLVADGAARLASRRSTTKLNLVKPGQLIKVAVDLWSTSIIFNKGHRIRISVTSGNYPRFGVNKSNGKAYPASQLGVGKKVKVTLHHSVARASYIELPDPTRTTGSVKKCGAVGPDAGVAKPDGAVVNKDGAVVNKDGAVKADVAAGKDAAGSGADVGGTLDSGQAATPGEGREGCSCEVGGREGEGWWVLLLAALFVRPRLRLRRRG